jgi:uncharacterized membrane protein YphA (DoxX/SURF4 family)
MCRNIKVLHHFEPPTTDDEIHAAALQYVRKVSGLTKAPAAAEANAAFEAAIAAVAAATKGLLVTLPAGAKPAPANASVRKPANAGCGAPSEINRGRSSIAAPLDRRAAEGNSAPVFLESPMSSAALSHAAPQSTRWTRFLPIVARCLLGLVFFVFGLDGFFHFFPAPALDPNNPAMAFGIALMNTGYMFKLIKGTEVLCGALLLSNRFVPLALAMLAPVVVNILGVHVFLDRSGLPIALVVLALELHLAWTYRSVYLPMLRARNVPTP